VAAEQARRRSAPGSDDDDAGAAHLRSSPSEIIAAPGGPVIVMGEFRWIWKSIHERLGVADPSPAGASLADKVSARRRAWHDFHASFATRDELLTALDRANLAWGIVRSGAEALASPTLAHRGSVVELDDPDGSYTVTRAPYRFSAGESGVRAGAPRQGEHHDEVLADWLGSRSATLVQQ
jgi:crotonobetainyl-CoA:carnitine CoA-transferase CaiB-like acyl-CoA transferase